MAAPLDTTGGIMMKLEGTEKEWDRLRRVARHFRDTADTALTERSRDYFNRLAAELEQRAEHAACAQVEAGDVETRFLPEC